jgi:Sec-independent protein translocase protein TatA
MSGLANMKRKLAEIDKEREKIINSQQKIKEDVSEMTDSFTKMSGDMVNLRKYLSDLSESVGRKMRELKKMMSSLINSRSIPTRDSSKRKKGKSSGTEHGSSSDETGIRPSIHASKSWDSMCEYDGENHRKQRAARPDIANANSATSVVVGIDVY